MWDLIDGVFQVAKGFENRHPDQYWIDTESHGVSTETVETSDPDRFVHVISIKAYDDLKAELEQWKAFATQHDKAGRAWREQADGLAEALEDQVNCGHCSPINYCEHCQSVGESAIQSYEQFNKGLSDD